MRTFLTILSSLIVYSACTTVYYNFWEKLGREKRDLLKSNIANVKEDQEELKEEFKDTLEKIRSEYKFDGGELEETYDRLSADYETAADKADTLSNRVDNVEEIAGDLFEEWKDEAEEITDPQYRRESKRKRTETMTKFSQMLTTMRAVEKNIDPILTKFKDQVLYLKHNLNARALGSFKEEFLTVENEINRLIKDMQKSTREADQFISEMQ